MKKIFLILSIALLSGCEPYIESSSRGIVVVNISNPMMIEETQELVDKHCEEKHKSSHAIKIPDNLKDNKTKYKCANTINLRERP
jgi:hypothetical protein